MATAPTTALDNTDEHSTTALYRAAVGEVNSAYYLPLFERFEAADRAGLELLAVDAELLALPPRYQPPADRLPRVRRVARTAEGLAAVGSRDARLALDALARLDAHDEAGFRAGVRALLAAGLLRPAGTVETDEDPPADEGDESQRASKAARAAEEASSEAASRAAASEAASSRVALGLSIGADAVSAVQSGLAEELSRQASRRADRWSQIAASAAQTRNSSGVSSVMRPRMPLR